MTKPTKPPPTASRKSISWPVVIAGLIVLGAVVVGTEFSTRIKRSADTAPPRKDADSADTAQKKLTRVEELLKEAKSLYAAQQLEKALEYCDEALIVLPGNSMAYNLRGVVWEAKGDFERALADYSRVISTDGQIAVLNRAEGLFNLPTKAQAYTNRGTLLLKMQKTDEATEDFTSAITISPDLWQAFLGRAHAWERKREFLKASQDYRQSIPYDPTIAARNGLAWLLATCPDSNVRDGRMALSHAEAIARITDWNEHFVLDTLAAACAESGMFPDAIKWETRAIELAPDGEKQAYRERLKLYQSGVPFRQP